MTHIHVLAVAGYAASGAALLAKELGHEVTGSDEHAYPPVSNTLTAAGIRWVDGYSPANLDRFGVPDLVVVSNTVRPHNVELAAARERGLAITSEAEFFTRLSGDRPRVAICGTHGKSTTAALLAHVLERAGRDPGFRLGAVSLDFDASARLGTGPFVFEGDEYATAPWDPRPKFAHIHPEAACITRLEHDHPDLYPTFTEYRECFATLTRELPADGVLALCADDPAVLTLRGETGARVVTYGEAPDADWRIVPSPAPEESRAASVSGTVGGAAPSVAGTASHGAPAQPRHAAGGVTGAGLDLQQFEIRTPSGPVAVSLTFAGRHSRQNASAALILAQHLGVPFDLAVAACADFRGPARRFERLAVAGGITVIDDYGHHPTEVEVTVATARERYPDRRIITVCIPHTYSRTRRFLDHYRRAFTGSDIVVLGPIEAARERHLPATITSEEVAAVVREGGQVPGDVVVVESAESALETVLAWAVGDDVVLCISLGGFDGFAERLADALCTREQRAAGSE